MALAERLPIPLAAASAHAYLRTLSARGGGGAAAAEEVLEVEEEEEAGRSAMAEQGGEGGVASTGAGGATDDGATDGSAADDVAAQTCPICLEERGEGAAWGITVCGHEGCFECMHTAVESGGCCPCCKRSLLPHMLYEVEATQPAVAAAAAVASPATRANDTTDETTDPVLEYGSKVCALLELVGDLQRSGEKCVVFSAWTRLLHLAHDALAVHGVTVASLVGSPAAKRDALARFSAGATVLLVPLFGGASGAGGGGAAGLTLTQANTAVLLEPALQPGIERQAAGRISRIGQQKATTLLRLIVSDTIESRIVDWQTVRMQEGATGSSAGSLSLNDFVQLLSE